MSHSYYRGRQILVTGGVGSVGREVVRQLMEYEPACIRIIDNNESGIFELEQEWSERKNLEFLQCDVTNASELQRVFGGIDICVHAAALKHVPSCERSPFSALHVNVNGVENVMKAAHHHGVEKVLFTSSDKAVNPTNVMGTSKLMGERLFTAMNAIAGAATRRTLFASTRFGNVAGSSGSVIPLFVRQIERGGPLTITDERMTRFVMANTDAVELVLRSAVHARGGEIFITKMPVLRIVDLARVMITLLAPVFGHDPDAIVVRTVGARPGEKLWEELSTEEESRRIFETDDFLVVFPALATDIAERSQSYPDLTLTATDRVYHSDRETCMQDEEIIAFLARPGVLPAALAATVSAGAGPDSTTPTAPGARTDTTSP